MSDRFKQEVLSAFQKVSPSRIDVEDDEVLRRYKQNHYNLFFNKLRFPPELFKGKNIIDFGCGTGEVDVVLSSWGALVRGFDFNPISIERANILKYRFKVPGELIFSVGDVDSLEIQPSSFDLAVSFGVIAHVPDQRSMFRRMAEATRPGGFVILGYVEDSGLIQRLLHRAIVRVNADKSDEDIYRIAQFCFKEHIDRSVQYGGRTASSVINDYLVNPHYIGLSSHTLMGWAADMGLEFYSTWPNTDLPFVVDSPYFKPIARNSPIYHVFVSLNRLRWLFGQQEDSEVFLDLSTKLKHFSEDIESFLDGLTNILQKETYTDTALMNFRDQRNAVCEGLEQAGHVVVSYAKKHLVELTKELERILELVVSKSQDGKDFDLEKVRGLLFKGYNGLGSSYTIWHKPA